MRVKSYYAASIESAMAKAGQDLGPDAVLITSRRAGPDARHLGEYEVVFGSLQEPTATVEAATPAESPDLHAQIALLRREVEVVRRTLSSAWKRSAAGASRPELAYAETVLAQADIAPELAEYLVNAIEGDLHEESLYTSARIGNRDLNGRLRAVQPRVSEMETRVTRLLRQQLDSMLTISPQIGRDSENRRIIAVVGPPGAGKTSTLVKLAVEFGLQTRRPSFIISTDSYRVGATEQLRAYSSTIGIGFQAVDTTVALGQLLQEQKGKELILIDTPGYGPAEMDAGEDLIRFLSLHPDIEVHLVLPANVRSADIERAAERFGSFGPAKLIATKLDETERFGALISHSILSAVPFSFLCAGQQIPDDLELATKDRLLSFVACEETSVSVTAA